MSATLQDALTTQASLVDAQRLRLSPPYAPQAWSSLQAQAADVLLHAGIQSSSDLLTMLGIRPGALDMPTEAKAAGMEELVLLEEGKALCLAVASREGEIAGDIPRHRFCAAIRDRLDLYLAVSAALKKGARTTFILLDEVFSVLSFNANEEVFGFLEERRVQLGLPHASDAPQSLTLPLIKTCNNLLRTLTKSSPSAVLLCGRVLMFMTSAYNVSAKFGVNLRGEFRDGGVEYEMTEEDHREDKEDVEMKQVAEDEVEVGSENGEVEEGEEREGVAAKKTKFQLPKLDLPFESFHSTFWSIQSYFANPTLLLPPPQSVASSSASTPPPSPMAIFQVKTERILKVLAEETAKEKVLRGSGDRKDETKTRREGLDESFLKYLTSRNLLEFELADVSFRRHVLIQFLILIQFLLSYATDTKTRPVPAKMQSFKPDDSTIEWLKDVFGRIVNELRQSHPGGEDVTRSILLILNREPHWTKWKSATCPPIERPPFPPSLLNDAVRRNQKYADEAREKRLPARMGTRALTNLFENGYKGIEQLQNPKKNQPIQTYLQKILSEELRFGKKRKIDSVDTPNAPDAALMTHEANQASLTWRAMRTLVRSDLGLLSNIVSGGSGTKPKIGSYVGILVKAIEGREEVRKESEGKKEDGEKEKDAKEAGVEGKGAADEPKEEEQKEVSKFGGGSRIEADDEDEKMEGDAELNGEKEKEPSPEGGATGEQDTANPPDVSSDAQVAPTAEIIPAKMAIDET